MSSKHLTFDIRNLSFRSLLLILVLVLIPVVILLRLRQTATPVAADWYNDSWNYRQKIAITNNSGTDLSDFQVKLSIGTSALIAAGKMQSTCADIRITDNNGKVLPHWVEASDYGCNYATTYIWVKIPTIPTTGTILYIYYGNTTATTIENPSAVFTLWDDFDSLANWQTGVYVAENNGPLAVTVSPGYNTPSSSSGNAVFDGTRSATDSSNEEGVLSGWWGRSIVSNTSIADNNFIVDTRLYFSETSSSTYAHYYYPFIIGVAQDKNNWISGRIATFNNNNAAALTVNREVGNTLANSSSVGTTFSPATWSDASFTFLNNGNSTYTYNGASQSYATGQTLTSKNVFVAFAHRAPSAVVTQYVKNIRVRKYTASPPTVDSPTAEEQSPAPVAWWKFDEGFGTQINNAGIGGTLTGTFATGTSAPTWITDSSCISGKCLSFAGNNYLSLGNPSVLKTASKTISFWAKPTASFPNITPVFSAISGNYYVGFNANGQMFTSHVNAAGAQKTTNTANNTVALNSWQYFSYVFNVVGGTTTVSFYKNGQPVSSTNYTDGYYSAYGTSFIIGAFATNSLFYTGLVDDLKVYSYARNNGQIMADYNSYSLSSPKGNQAILGNLQTGGTAPLAYWNFDEGTGTTAYDSSGNNNNAGWSGTLGSQWTVGKFGKAGNFNGTDNYLGTGNTASYPQFTVETWFKLSSSVSQERGIITKYVSTIQNGSWTLQTITGNSLLWDIDDGAQKSCSTSITPGVWYHAAGVYTGSSGILYLNGLSACSFSVGTITSLNDEIRIGYARTGYFMGSIDETKIYNYARSPAQIVQDMNAGHPAGNATAATAYFKFDEGSGTVANNSVSSGQNGTISGATWTNNGRIGRALTFDGSTSRVYTASRLFSQLDNWTLSAWVNPANFTPTDQFVLYNGTDGGGYGFTVNGGGGTNGRLMGIFGGIRWINSGYTFPSTNQWYHVVMLRNSGIVKFYVNGIQTSGTDSGGNPNTVANYFEVGHEPTYSGSRYFYGSVDEVKVYNYPLSPTDILIDYNQGQALNFGANSQSTGSTASINSFSQTYCIPGDTSSCNPPIAYWDFNEHTGTTAYDTSGNNYNAGFSGSPTWVSGKFSSGITTNNTVSDYVNAPNVSIGTSWTAEIWFSYPLSTVGNTWSTLFRSNVNDHQVIVQRSSNLLGMYDNTTGGAFRSTGFNMATLSNGWHHLAITGYGGNQYFYIDGVFVGQTDKQSTSDIKAIGNYQGGSQNWGTFDDVKIFNYVRTPAQIAYDYNHGGPIAWYKFDEGQGTISNNAGSIGSTLNLTLSGTTLPAWTTGKFSQALYFNGVNSYLSVAENGNHSLDLKTGAFSGSAWIKIVAPNTYHTPILQKGATSSVAAGYWWAVQPDGTMDLLISDGSSYIVSLSGSKNLANGQWHQVMFIWNPAVGAKLYADGKLDGSTNVTSSVNITNSNILSVGQYPSTGFVLNGYLDDVRIYNYALTSVQIQNLYNNTSTVNFNQLTPTP